MTPAVADRWLSRAAEAYGTPCFVYFAEPVEERIDALERAFGGRFRLSFAVKSNPNPAVLAWLERRIAMLDASSIGEIRLGLAAGWDPSRITFTGPAKRDLELREAIVAGVGALVLESLREARAADRIARDLGLVQKVLIRIAPAEVPRGFGDQMAGRPCAFGIDIEDADVAVAAILKLANLEVEGFHIYSGTQCLAVAPVVENWCNFLRLFRALCARHRIEPKRLVLGSGLGIPYHAEQEPIDLPAVGEAVNAKLDALMEEPGFEEAELTLELGRYLIGEAGYFVTRVVSIKESRGSRIAICDGGMNNHLPAAGHFGMVVRRPYVMHKVGGLGGCEQVDIVGPLCTSIDRLASGISLPALGEGDLIAVHNSGAYGLTASPVHFISHAPPSEVLVSGTTMRDVTRYFGDHQGGPLHAGDLWNLASRH